MVEIVRRKFVVGALLSSVSSWLSFLIFAVVFVLLSSRTMHAYPSSVEAMRESGAGS